MTRMKTVRALGVVAFLGPASLLAGCGGSAPAPASATPPETPPPRLPPSMGAAGPKADDPKAAAPPPSDAGGLVDRGRAALSHGDVAAAKQGYKDALAKDPTSADAADLLGLIDEREGKKDAAEAAYRDALKKKPDLESAAVDLSAFYVDAGRFDDAVAVARAGLAKHPDSGPLNLNEAVALAGKGDTAGSTHAFDEAVRRTPSDAMTLVTYAHWLGAWKQKDAAIAKLRAARPLAGDDVGVLDAVGHELRLVGGFADCITAFDQAIGKKDAAELRVERALCKLGAKDDAGATADLQAAVKADPSYPPAHFYLAGRFATAGKLPEAIAEYEAYLKVAPSGPMAHAAQDRIRFAKDRLKK